MGRMSQVMVDNRITLILHTANSSGYGPSFDLLCTYYKGMFEAGSILKMGSMAA